MNRERLVRLICCDRKMRDRSAGDDMYTGSKGVIFQYSDLGSIFFFSRGPTTGVIYSFNQG